MDPDRPPSMHEQRLQELMHTAGTVSHLMRNTFAFVMAGGRGSRLHELTDWRAKPALPFAGKLRLIDFPLSNCVNSGIRRIAVLTQYKAQSLIRHIERGWNILAHDLAEFIDVVPAQQQVGENWYAGTADALFQNLSLVQEAHAARVLVLGGDHVYKMDYAAMVAEHALRGADVTVACVEVPLAEASLYGVMAVDGERRVIAFEEKPAHAAPMPGAEDRALASMGIYLFDAPVLSDALARDAADRTSSHDFGRDVIPRLLATHRVFAHRFADSCVNMVEGRPYWRDVGSIDAYWAANLDLTRTLPELNLYDERWPILSQQAQLPPAKFVFDEAERRGTAIDSLVSGGCIVSGATVRRSVLFANVRVDERSLIEDSVVLPEVRVGRRVTLRRAVVDKRCVLPDGFRAGLHPDEDRARFRVTDSGIVLITPSMLGQPVDAGDTRPGKL